MTNPLVHCAGCARAWHSPTMVDGLRQVGSCPRCGGTLIYADEATAPSLDERPAGGDPSGTELAPHLVLGVPRR